MPGFDKTGPQGLGPRTGRGLGLCAKSNKLGIRFGLGRRCRGFGLNLTKREDLEAYKKTLQEEIEGVDKQLASS